MERYILEKYIYIKKNLMIIVYEFYKNYFIRLLLLKYMFIYINSILKLNSYYYLILILKRFNFD